MVYSKKFNITKFASFLILIMMLIPNITLADIGFSISPFNSFSGAVEHTATYNNESVRATGTFESSNFPFMIFGTGESGGKISYLQHELKATAVGSNNISSRESISANGKTKVATSAILFGFESSTKESGLFGGVSIGWFKSSTINTTDVHYIYDSYYSSSDINYKDTIVSQSSSGPSFGWALNLGFRSTENLKSDIKTAYELMYFNANTEYDVGGLLFMISISQ